MLETSSESAFRYWENVHYQFRQGLCDEEEFSKHLDTMIELTTNDVAFKSWLCTRQLLYSKPFVDNLTAKLDSQLCE